ncbi:hypothetical protein DXO012_14405, partial [Xanthomonas oryzae pv. oryzae]
MDLVRLVRIDIGVAYASARFASQLQLILSWPLFWSSALSMLTKLELTLRFPHISSCEINHLVGHAVEEGARM